jgi:hypothetical protein
MTDVEHVSRKETAVPIGWFPVPEESELPDGLRGLFVEARGRNYSPGGRRMRRSGPSSTT